MAVGQVVHRWSEREEPVMGESKEGTESDARTCTRPSRFNRVRATNMNIHNGYKHQQQQRTQQQQIESSDARACPGCMHSSKHKREAKKKLWVGDVSSPHTDKKKKKETGRGTDSRSWRGVNTTMQKRFCLSVLFFLSLSFSSTLPAIPHLHSCSLAPSPLLCT